MERQIDLHPSAFHRVVRIAFLLPREGNDTEYMAIDKDNPHFKRLIDISRNVADNICGDERRIRQEEERKKRYEQYLRLKEEFENE